MSPPPAATRGGLRRLAAVVLFVVTGAGCAVFRPEPLDVPPGQRVVVGRIVLEGFDLTEAIVEIVRDDRSFDHALPVGIARRDFLIMLPPGRYRITTLRAFKDRDAVSSNPIVDLKASFEVGLEPAVYIGTLRIGSRFGQSPAVTVADDYEETVRTLRGQHPDLPEVTRQLLTPN